MKYQKSWLAAAALVMSLGLGGCGHAATEGSAGSEGEAPVQLSEADQHGVKTVTLSEQAAQRLGLADATVRRVAAQSSLTGRPQLVMPYAALVYDQGGQTWAYLISQPLTYVRTAVTVDHIDGDAAYLSSGPDSGSAVVTTGSEELLGAEYEISGE
jgi:hypothetical protein